MQKKNHKKCNRNLKCRIVINIMIMNVKRCAEMFRVQPTPYKVMDEGTEDGNECCGVGL